MTTCFGHETTTLVIARCTCGYSDHDHDDDCTQVSSQLSQIRNLSGARLALSCIEPKSTVIDILLFNCITYSYMYNNMWIQ